MMGLDQMICLHDMFTAMSHSLFSFFYDNHGWELRRPGVLGEDVALSLSDIKFHLLNNPGSFFVVLFVS